MASAALQRRGAVVTCRATQCVGLSDLMALQLLVLGNYHRMQEDLSMALASQGLLFPAVLRVTRSPPLLYARWIRRVKEPRDCQVFNYFYLRRSRGRMACVF